MTTFNKKQIFSNAWNLVKTTGVKISQALKSAWAIAKSALIIVAAPMAVLAPEEKTVTLSVDRKVYSAFDAEYNEPTGNEIEIKLGNVTLSDYQISDSDMGVNFINVSGDDMLQIVALVCSKSECSVRDLGNNTFRFPKNAFNKAFNI